MNALRSDLQKLAAAAEASFRPEGPWRPGIHLAPPVGWLNDPNGLCCFQGEYHIFYQYAPFDAGGGVKFWGHYKSKDLISWVQCPVMLCPDEPYDIHGVYSGSALCREDGLYLYYTGNVKYDGDFDYIHAGREGNTVLAYSADGIRLNWKLLLLRNKDYPSEMTLHVRDPKVWKQDGRYYMIQGARTQEDAAAALIFESKDGFQWEHINTLRTAKPFGYMWECPDLFEIDGQWILIVCPQGVQKKGPGLENRYACGYFPLWGDFRGDYTLGEFIPLDFGFDFYAPQTFLDRDRRLLIAWMGMPDAEYTNPTVAYGWQHCLTSFRELRLKGGRLCMRPIQELEHLHEETRTYSFSERLTVDLPEIADIQITCGGALSLALSGISLKAENGSAALTVHEGGYGRDTRTAFTGGLRNLRILADSSAIEFFVNDGEVSLSARWYPADLCLALTLYGEGQAVVYAMRSMEITKYAETVSAKRKT